MMISDHSKSKIITSLSTHGVNVQYNSHQIQHTNEACEGWYSAHYVSFYDKHKHIDKIPLTTYNSKIVKIAELINVYW